MAYQTIKSGGEIHRYFFTRNMHEISLFTSLWAGYFYCTLISGDNVYIFYNNNPAGLKIGDCVVRAISTALSQSWEKTYVGLCIEGFMFRDMPNANAVWASYLRSKGFLRHSLPDNCPDCYSIADFARDHKNGVYVVATGNHAVCVKGGNILDNWDSSGETAAYYFSLK